VIERRVSALEAMTAGVNVPFDLEIVEDLHAALPRRLGEGKLADLIDDRRLAETIYRVALADGIMDRIAYRDVLARYLIEVVRLPRRRSEPCGLDDPDRIPLLRRRASTAG
jgi:hypothetical protein